jgi:hypothetical protein
MTELYFKPRAASAPDRWRLFRCISVRNSYSFAVDSALTVQAFRRGGSRAEWLRKRIGSTMIARSWICMNGSAPAGSGSSERSGDHAQTATAFERLRTSVRPANGVLATSDRISVCFASLKRPALVVHQRGTTADDQVKREPAIPLLQACYTAFRGRATHSDCRDRGNLPDRPDCGDVRLVGSHGTRRQ